MGDPTYLYHYTDYNGMKAIQESGYIRMSSRERGDAYYGDGVYLTAIPPESPTYLIILNNYDDDMARARNLRFRAKSKYCFGIPRAAIREVRQVGKSSSDGRDVWLFPDNLTLAGKGVTIYERDT